MEKVIEMSFKNDEMYAGTNSVPGRLFGILILEKAFCFDARVLPLQDERCTAPLILIASFMPAAAVPTFR